MAGTQTPRVRDGEMAGRRDVETPGQVPFVGKWQQSQPNKIRPEIYLCLWTASKRLLSPPKIHTCQILLGQKLFKYLIPILVGKGAKKRRRLRAGLRFSTIINRKLSVFLGSSVCE